MIVFILCANVTFADPIVLDENTDWAELEDPQNQGTVLLDNHDQTPANCDYIIADDLIFGTQEINYNFTIEAGVRIWFNLEVADYGNNQDTCQVTDVYTIEIQNSKILICGDNNDLDNPVIFEPNPTYSTAGDDFLHGGYPICCPPDAGEEDQDVYAGGLLLNTSDNCTFENTRFHHLIGNRCDRSVDWDNMDIKWRATEGLIGIGSRSWFAILINDDSDVIIDNCEIYNCWVNGVCINDEHGDVDFLNSLFHSTSCFPCYFDDLDEELEYKDLDNFLGVGIRLTCHSGNNTINFTDSFIGFMPFGEPVGNRRFGIVDESDNNNIILSNTEIIGHRIRVNPLGPLTILPAGIYETGDNCNISMDNCCIAFNWKGIIFDNWDNSQLIVENENLINENLSTGIVLLNCNNDEIYIGENHGNCQINENGQDGINSTSSENISLNLFNCSTVNLNEQIGIDVWGDSDNPHAVDNFNTTLRDSEISLNGAHGIHYRKQDFSEILLVNSRVNNNGDANNNYGIWGYDSYNVDVHVRSQSQVNNNGGTGIYFQATYVDPDDIPLDLGCGEDGAYHIPPELLDGGTWCADCFVQIWNDSEVNSNQGNSIHNGGIVMMGLGHSCIVECYSSVSSNEGNGVLMYTYDFSDFTASIECDVSNNGKHGIWIYRPRSLNVLRTDVSNNRGINVDGGGDGIRAELYTWGRPEIEAPDDPRNPEEEELMVFNVDVHNNDELDEDISENTGDGIYLQGIPGYTLEGGGFDINVSETSIHDNVHDGIRMCHISSYREFFDIPIECHFTDCHIYGNNDGIEYGPSISYFVIEADQLQITNNQNGIRATDEVTHTKVSIANSTIDLNAVNGILVEETDDVENNYGTPRDNFELSLTNVEISNGNIGIQLDATTADSEIGPLFLKMHNCYVHNNQIGLNCEDREWVHLWIAPVDPTVTPGNEVSEFDENIFGINISYPDGGIGGNDNHAPKLLIDRVKFNELTDQALVSFELIRLTGDIDGFDNENFGTIRKCRFASSDHGIILCSNGNASTPDVLVRNNFFIDLFKESIWVNFEQPSQETILCFNTIVNDANPVPMMNGIVMEQTQGNSAALGDYQIYNTILENLDVAAIEQRHPNVEPEYGGLCIPNPTPFGPGWWEGDNVIIDPSGRINMQSEKLAFNSDCINMGVVLNGEMDKTYIESIDEVYVSFPDIGCTGGEVWPGILDHNHYSVFDNVVFENNFDLFLDEYEVIGGIQVNPNVTLQLEVVPGDNEQRNTVFFMHENSSIEIHGAVDVQGLIDDADLPEDDRRGIRFDKFPDEGKWSGIIFNDPNMGSEIVGCEICNANNCVKAFETENGIQIIELDQCLLEGGEYANLYVSDDIRLDCDDNIFRNSASHGIELWLNGQLSNFDHYLIENNGSASDNSGVMMYAAGPTFTRNRVRYNYNYGFYCFAWSPTDIGDDDPENGAQSANDIYNNGQTLEQPGQYGLDGSEFYIWNNADAEIWQNNIWDVVKDVGTRLGKFVYIYAMGHFDCDNTYWGDGWHNADEFDHEDEDQIADYFNGVDEEDIEDKSDTYHDAYEPGDEDGPEWGDNVENYFLAKGYQASGDYDNAIRIYIDYVASDPDGRYAINSINRLLDCYRSRDRSLSELKDLYLTWIDRFGSRRTNFAWACRRFAAMCSYYENDFDTALSELTGMLDEAPLVSDSLFIELDIALIEDVQNRDAVDNAYNTQVRIEKVENELYKLARAGNPEQKAAEIPTDFQIVSAYPNPFNSTVTIHYLIPESNRLSIEIYDVNGREAENLFHDVQLPGSHKVIWHAMDYPAGIYFCRMDFTGESHIMKLHLVK